MSADVVLQRAAARVLRTPGASPALLRALAHCLDPAQTEMGEPIVWEQTQDGWQGTTTITRFGPEWRTHGRVGTMPEVRVAVPEVAVTITAVIEHGDHEQDDVVSLQVERIAYEYGHEAVELGGEVFLDPTDAELDWADSERQEHRSAVEAAQ